MALLNAVPPTETADVTDWNGEDAFPARTGVAGHQKSFLDILLCALHEHLVCVVESDGFVGGNGGGDDGLWDRDG